MTRFILLLIAFTIILCSYKNQSEFKKTENIKPTKKEVINFNREKTPFGISTKIEILNYRNVIKQGDSTFYNGFSSSYASNHSPQVVDKKVVLDSTQTNELFDIIYAEIEEETIPYECFSPHHSIIFYREKDIIFYNHLCLSCLTYQKSNTYDFPLLDHDKWCKLRFFFEKLGLKTTYSIEDEYACGRKPLDE